MSYETRLQKIWKAGRIGTRYVVNMIKSGLLLPSQLWWIIRGSHFTDDYMHVKANYFDRTIQWLKEAAVKFKEIVVNNPIKVFLATMGILIAFLPVKKIVNSAVSLVSPVASKVATIARSAASGTAKAVNNHIIRPTVYVSGKLWETSMNAYQKLVDAGHTSVDAIKNFGCEEDPEPEWMPDWINFFWEHYEEIAAQQGIEPPYDDVEFADLHASTWILFRKTYPSMQSGKSRIRTRTKPLKTPVRLRQNMPEMHAWFNNNAEQLSSKIMGNQRILRILKNDNIMQFNLFVLSRFMFSFVCFFSFRFISVVLVFFAKLL